jgi:hypothetical protein
MREDVTQHLQRLELATINRYTRKDLSRWVCENTYIQGRKFSVKNHEFQSRIMNDPSQELVIIKSAQLGISEMSMRMALALIMTTPGGMAIGYVFPTMGFSQQYMRTRLEPIISSSPALRSASTSEDLDSAAVKTFGPNRQLYAKGAATGNAAISTSLDAVFHDEFSFQDQEVAGDYTSRLIHSPHKIKVKLSTPTFPGDPIDTAFQNSRRWVNMCRCHHCNNEFYPDYYEHVKVPGFSGDLDEITQENLYKYDYFSAKLLCPACGKEPNLGPDHRFWVCENPNERHLATGYRLSPFDAPKIITIPYLVEASTSYANKAKFRQFNLGKASADSESGLTEEDLAAIGVEINQSPYRTHVMGIDLGMTCHFMVGGVGSDLKLGVVHMERVPLAKFRERYFALKAQFRVSITVSDIQPYTDLIMGLCAEDVNLFGASYITRAGLELFDVRQREADDQAAIGELRQVSVNRNALFDKLLSEARSGQVWIRKTQEWDTLRRHLLDMKRVSATLRNGEFTSLWQKSAKGVDHYHHSFGYLYVASQMRGVASGAIATGGAGVRTFKMQDRLAPAKTPAQMHAEMMERYRSGMRR